MSTNGERVDNEYPSDEWQSDFSKDDEDIHSDDEYFTSTDDEIGEHANRNNALEEIGKTGDVPFPNISETSEVQNGIQDLSISLTQKITELRPLSTNAPQASSRLTTFSKFMGTKDGFSLKTQTSKEADIAPSISEAMPVLETSEPPTNVSPNDESSKIAPLPSVQEATVLNELTQDSSNSELGQNVENELTSALTSNENSENLLAIQNGSPNAIPVGLHDVKYGDFSNASENETHNMGASVSCALLEDNTPATLRRRLSTNAPLASNRFTTFSTFVGASSDGDLTNKIHSSKGGDRPTVLFTFTAEHNPVSSVRRTSKRPKIILPNAKSSKTAPGHSIMKVPRSNERTKDSSRIRDERTQTDEFNGPKLGKNDKNEKTSPLMFIEDLKKLKVKVTNIDKRLDHIEKRVSQIEKHLIQTNKRLFKMAEPINLSNELMGSVLSINFAEPINLSNELMGSALSINSADEPVNMSTNSQVPHSDFLPGINLTITTPSASRFSRLLATNGMSNSARRTHRQYFHQLMKREIQVFRPQRRNIPSDPCIRDLIGIQVYRWSDCPAGSLCPQFCPYCQACCHEYVCTCKPPKLRATNWCPHIHAALENGECKFGDAFMAFILDKWQFPHPQMAHLRATCYDIDDDVIVRERNRIFIVKECSSYLVHDIGASAKVLQTEQVDICDRCVLACRCLACNICLHVFSCSCHDYLMGNLCEHCHVVALYKSKYPEVGSVSSESEDESIDDFEELNFEHLGSASYDKFSANFEKIMFGYNYSNDLSCRISNLVITKSTSAKPKLLTSDKILSTDSDEITDKNRSSTQAEYMQDDFDKFDRCVDLERSWFS